MSPIKRIFTTQRVIPAIPLASLEKPFAATPLTCQGVNTGMFDEAADVRPYQHARRKPQCRAGSRSRSPASCTLTISDIAFGGGEGVGRVQDFVIFVPFVLVGEVVEVEIIEVKKHFARAPVAM